MAAAHSSRLFRPGFPPRSSATRHCGTKSRCHAADRARVAAQVVPSSSSEAAGHTGQPRTCTTLGAPRSELLRGVDGSLPQSPVAVRASVSSSRPEQARRQLATSSWGTPLISRRLCALSDWFYRESDRSIDFSASSAVELKFIWIEVWRALPAIIPTRRRRHWLVPVRISSHRQ